MLDFEQFPRVSLCHQPTPVERMPRLTDHLGGPALWIKREEVRRLRERVARRRQRAIRDHNAADCSKEQDDRSEETHGRAAPGPCIVGPCIVDWRWWKNSLSTASSGREVSTENRHRSLYEKYKARPLP